MSILIFDGDENSLTLLTSDGKMFGRWQASNRVANDPTNAPLNYIPDGDYTFLDEHSPHRHNPGDDSPSGRYGTYGILRLKPMMRHGIQIGHEESPLGIHSGRMPGPGSPRGLGPFHWTWGCIRTSDAAMKEIVMRIQHDGLTHLRVQNNGSSAGAVRASAGHH
jgi:hypothetical protein